MILIPDFLEFAQLNFGLDVFLTQVIFLLIIVNRDEDAYNLFTSVGSRFGATQFDSCSFHETFKKTYKGDWIYLTGQDKTGEVSGKRSMPCKAVPKSLTILPKNWLKHPKILQPKKWHMWTSWTELNHLSWDTSGPKLSSKKNIFKCT
jgi:hypothetical protein